MTTDNSAGSGMRVSRIASTSPPVKIATSVETHPLIVVVEGLRNGMMGEDEKMGLIWGQPCFVLTMVDDIVSKCQST